MDTESAAPETLHFELRLALALRPDGLKPAWQAELLGPTPGERLHFQSLPALIRFLARLDPHLPASRGIR
ncbi:MAG: hypothetical protein ABIQ06_14840 [Caldimonas sp.]